MAAFGRLVSRLATIQINPATPLRNSIAVNGVLSAVGGYAAQRGLRSSSSSHLSGTSPKTSQFARAAQETVADPEADELAKAKSILEKVQSRITDASHGRLFAVVHIAGKQFRVTDGDLIAVQGRTPTRIGDALRLEKVLLVGAADFTLLGRPLVRSDLVDVEATVVEKTLSHTKTHFRKKRRKQYMRINFYRNHYDVLRVESVRLRGSLQL